MKYIKIILLSCLLGGLFSVGASAQSSEEEKIRYFSISGTAEIRVKPDRVTMVVGITERSLDLIASKNKMNEVIQTVLAYGKKKGIAEKNMQIAHIQINPNYYYDSDKRKTSLTHYDIQQNLSITLEDVDMYNQFIYDLLEMGVNTIQDIQFTSSEMRKYRDQARIQAIQAAKEKAKLLTDAAGVKLGRVDNVREDNFYAPVYRLGGMQANFSQNVAYDQSGGGSDASGGAVGMIPIEATVTLTYRLVD